MPRPNLARSIASEETLAKRIRHELAVRDMKPSTLATRMSDAGCAITTSAIYKIVNAADGAPARRITVDELVALSRVLNVPIADLLLPAEAVADRDLRKALREWDHATARVREARRRADEAWQGVLAVARGNTDVARVLEPVMSDWVLANRPKEAHRAAFGLKMYELTGDHAWLEGALDDAPPDLDASGLEGAVSLALRSALAKTDGD